ncbi:single-stranded DNA-binding protein [Cysteiniphilum litorale]|uniref:single-stranded DNA-binding protein n=1 Tax=Cysteiniphilum litorale TaxID=2056700 RepID=UPI003F8853A6
MARGTVNKVTLVGRLGANPELRYMPSGMAAANIRLATNDGYKDRQTGQFIEHTEWHRVSIFGKLAETLSQYVKKGDLLYIEGRIRTTKYQDKVTGQDRYNTEVIATEMQMLGGHAHTDNTITQTVATPSSAPVQAHNPQQSTPSGNPPTLDDLENFDSDEVPF